MAATRSSKSEARNTLKNKAPLAVKPLCIYPPDLCSNV
jgi:hypothetical protein